MKKLYIDVAVEELSRDNPPEPIPEARVAAFETAFTSVHSALGAQALGWYRFRSARIRAGGATGSRWRSTGGRRAEPTPIRNCPRRSTTIPPILAQLALRPEDYRRTPRAYPNSSLLIGHDTESYVDTQTGLAKTVEGYVRALARAVAVRRGRGARPQMAGALVAAARRADRHRRRRAFRPGRRAHLRRAAGALRQLIEEDRSAAGAEALGWRAYRAKDYSGAERWLRAAIDWRPAEVKLGLDLARAYADTLRALKRYDEALSFVEATSARAPGLGGFAVDIGLDSLGALDPHSARRRSGCAASPST